MSLLRQITAIAATFFLVGFALGLAFSLGRLAQTDVAASPVTAPAPGGVL